MELVSRRFRLERSSSTLLRSESISRECKKIVGYEKLSESKSMRMRCWRHLHYKSNGRRRAFGFISKVFSFMKVSGNGEVMRHKLKSAQDEMKKEKKRSSWLPDPERRWPVQGW